MFLQVHSPHTPWNICKHAIWCPYTVSGNFMSVLQDLIAEVIPSHKCLMNGGLIPTPLNFYEKQCMQAK